MKDTSYFHKIKDFFKLKRRMEIFKNMGDDDCIINSSHMSAFQIVTKEEEYDAATDKRGGSAKGRAEPTVYDINFNVVKDGTNIAHVIYEILYLKMQDDFKVLEELLSMARDDGVFQGDISINIEDLLEYIKNRESIGPDD